MGKINGISIKFLRDSEASYDMVHSNYIKPKDLTGKCINVRGVLSEDSVALPVAEILLDYPGVGIIKTEAAVCNTLPEEYPYLLSNRTWDMLKDKREAATVLALTRSKARKLMQQANLDTQIQEGNLEIIVPKKENNLVGNI